MNKNFFNDYFDDEEELNDNEEEFEQRDKQSGKTFTKGFVTALSICLAAIGAAVWTTVQNVNSYLNPEIQMYRESETDLDEQTQPTYEVVSSLTEQEAEVNATVSGVKDDKKSKQEKENSNEPVVFTSPPINNKKVTAAYSEVPIYDQTFGDFRAHTGIDYEADIDDKVRAMGNGVVKNIYYDDLLGNVVVIEHSKTVDSYYCGLARTTLVQTGEVVSAGDFVGTVYAIPCESAQPAHIHVAVKENGKWVNPAQFFK